MLQKIEEDLERIFLDKALWHFQWWDSGYDDDHIDYRGALELIRINKWKKMIKKKSKLKSKSKPKSKMEVADIVKLDLESFNKLKEMLSSPDKENHTVAFGVLKNLDMKVNLPYVLLLHKFDNEKNPEQWKELHEPINKALKAIGEPKLDSVTYITIYKTVKGNYPRQELQVVVDEFAESMKKRIVDWGFEFLKDLDLKITVPEEK